MVRVRMMGSGSGWGSGWAYRLRATLPIFLPILKYDLSFQQQGNWVSIGVLDPSHV